MCTETNPGWPNRETSAFHRWITNEQATCEEARRITRYAVEGASSDDLGAGGGRYAAAAALSEWWCDTLDAARQNGYSETLRAMREEVGSLSRIDWRAIADALLAQKT